MQFGWKTAAGAVVWVAAMWTGASALGAPAAARQSPVSQPAQPAPAAAAAPAAPVVDVTPPPAEELRTFLDEGPALLLPAAERERLTELAAHDSAAALAEARAFLARDPIPETGENELELGIARRQRAIWADGLSFRDARARLRFLRGAPRERLKNDCGETYNPLEIWSWGPVETPERLVVYRPHPGAFFVAWRPIDSKRGLYTEMMEYYLEQWDELRGFVSGKRPDRVLCDQSKLIDKITGVDGLFHFEKERPTDASIDAFFAPPADLAIWARGAMAEKVERRESTEPAPEEGGDAAAAPPAPGKPVSGRKPAPSKTPPAAAPPSVAAMAPVIAVEPLPVEGIAVSFPEKVEQRLKTRIRIVLPADVGAGVVQAETGKESRFAVTGRIEHDGAPFDEFRNRYVLPMAQLAPAAAGQEESAAAGKIILIADRPLRTGPYVVTLEIRDEVAGRTTWLTRGFSVPTNPTPEPSMAKKGAVEVIGEASGLTEFGGRDALVLLPPLSDVIFGLWRAEAIVAGERIRKVVFYLDGVKQLERSAAPWSAELRLPHLPSEMVVRAEGLDESGAVVASDEVVLNEPQEEAAVRLLAPLRGAKITTKTTARAAVVVPEGKRVESVEFRLNDTVLATLTKPPWEVALPAPVEGEPTYLTVAATYTDGTRVEDFRVLSGTPFGEQIDVDLVELAATVFDHGRLVENLQQEDFTILDRGKPQAINRFELMRDLPLALGIVLDTSGSMHETIGEAKRAATEFLAAMIHEKDRCFAVAFSSRPRLLMPLTPDAQAVEAAFRDLPAMGNTSLHDAIIFSLYQLKGVRGRKALVLLSDGDDTSSLVSYADSLEFARRSGTAIYTIGLDVGALNLGIKEKLQTLSSETGGRSFFVSKAAELAGVYSEIERELRSQYLLAFAPNPPGKPGVFSPVEVKVKGGLKARAPRGYYP